MRKICIFSLLLLLAFPVFAQYRVKAVNLRELERMEEKARQDSIARIRQQERAAEMERQAEQLAEQERLRAVLQARNDSILLMQTLMQARQDSIKRVQLDSIAAVERLEKQHKDSLRHEKMLLMPIAWQKGCKLRIDLSGGALLYNGFYKEKAFCFSMDFVLTYACNPWLQLGIGARTVPSVSSLTPILDMRVYLSPYENKKVRAYFDISGGYTVLYNDGIDKYLYGDLVEGSPLIKSAYYSESEKRKINGTEYQCNIYYLMNGKVQQKANGAMSFGIETLHGFVVGVTYSFNYMTARVIGVAEYVTDKTTIRTPIQNNIATHKMMYHNIALNIGWNIPLAKERRELK